MFQNAPPGNPAGHFYTIWMQFITKYSETLFSHCAEVHQEYNENIIGYVLILFYIRGYALLFPCNWIKVVFCSVFSHPNGIAILQDLFLNRLYEEQTGSLHCDL